MESTAASSASAESRLVPTFPVAPTTTTRIGDCLPRRSNLNLLAPVDAGAIAERVDAPPTRVGMRPQELAYLLDDTLADARRHRGNEADGRDARDDRPHIRFVHEGEAGALERPEELGALE